jgi:NTP pyrophosphatase (non-canonical NTP hydrolase)
MNGQSSAYFKQFDTLPVHEYSGTAEIFDNLLDGQHELMELMDWKKFPKDLYFFLTANNLVKEALEASEFWGDVTKPWKEAYEVDFAHIKEEWLDILFFWLQGAIVLGLTADEIFFGYFEKQLKNKERIKVKLNET